MQNKFKDKEYWPYLFLGSIFLVSRVIYYLSGIRYDISTLEYQWHFIDLPLLKTDFWRSLFYLHSQPPLLNFITGSVINLFPERYASIFHALSVVCGLFLCFALFYLMKQLGIPVYINAGLVALFIISPATILYENWLYYTYPATTILVISAALLPHALKKNGFGFLFFLLLALLSLTWSLFHLIWFVLITLLVCAVRRPIWKVILISLIPLLLVLGWSIKNQIVFGEFTSSTWLGMNLSHLTTSHLSLEKKNQMISQGELSAFARIDPFSEVDDYLPLLPKIPETGIPVLDQKTKSNGSPNYNNIAYIQVSNFYLKDALALIRSEPLLYLKGIGRALFIYFHSSSDYFPLDGQKKHIDKLERFWNIVFLGQLQNYRDYQDRLLYRQPGQVGWFIVLAFGLSMLVGGRAILDLCKQKEKTPADKIAIIFIAFNILFVTLASSMLDMDENNRFRFIIDPFLLVMLGLGLRYLWESRKKIPQLSSLRGKKSR